MCNPPTIAHSTSFESISSYSPSSSCTSKRIHIRGGMSSKSMSNSFGKDSHFLDFCSLCKRKLFLGDDIYMYKGDTPFCSEECRHEQIEVDERKEKMQYKTSKVKAIQSSKVDNVYARAAAAVFV